MLGLAVPAVTTISKSSNLNNAGRLVSNLLTMARSEAINQRTIVRVEVATDWPPDQNYRFRKATLTKATLDQASGNYSFRQFTGWETLPDGIVFEINDPIAASTPSDGSKYFRDTSGTLQNTNNSLTIGSATVPTVYFAFTPAGGLNIPSGMIVPIRARLVEGFPNGATSIAYTHKSTQSSSAPANWFDLRVNPLVGRIEIGRPEAPLP